jgi:DNA-binding GntR family transcriptional regulator
MGDETMRTAASLRPNPGTRRVVHHLLLKAPVHASAEIADALQVPEGRALARIDTLAVVDGWPSAVVRHYLRIASIPSLLRDYEGGPLADFLQRHHGFRPRIKHTSFGGTEPEQRDEPFLQLIPGSATVLTLTTLGVHPWTRRPALYAVTYFRAENTRIILEPLIA